MIHIEDCFHGRLIGVPYFCSSLVGKYSPIPCLPAKEFVMRLEYVPQPAHHTLYFCTIVVSRQFDRPVYTSKENHHPSFAMELHTRRFRLSNCSVFSSPSNTRTHSVGKSSKPYTFTPCSCRTLIISQFIWQYHRKKQRVPVIGRGRFLESGCLEVHIDISYLQDHSNFLSG